MDSRSQVGKGFNNAQYRAALLSPQVRWWYVSVLLAAVPVIALSGQLSWLGPAYFAVTVLFLVGVVPMLAQRRREESEA